MEKNEKIRMEKGNKTNETSKYYFTIKLTINFYYLKINILFFYFYVLQ